MWEVLVTNKKESKGSLKLKKQVTVKGEETTGTEADGSYTFTIAGPTSAEKADQVSKTVVITIENGVTKSAAVDGETAAVGTDGYVEVTDLAAGDYTITETAPTNGTALTGASGGKSVSDDKVVTVTVEAGKTADAVADAGKASFTNNKPDVPSFEKKIMDTNDSTGETSGWQDSADYDIGDDIPYKLTATLASDVSSYQSYSIRFEDKMEDSLSFKGVSQVLLTKSDGSTQDLTADSTIAPVSGGQSFTVSIVWSGDSISELLNGATVDVFFTAELNSNAKIGSEGNVNAARLHYSNNPASADDSDTTPWDYVIAFTYKLDVNKVDQDGNALSGAEFKLEKKLSGGGTRQVALSQSGNVFTGTGLDDGIYVLTETTTPEGYKPIDPIEFTVSAAHGVTWNYNSDGDAPAFNGTGRTGILTELTGNTESGDLTFAAQQQLSGLAGTVKNQGIGALKLEKKVEGTTAKDKDFTFEIALTAPTGVTLDSSYPAKLDDVKTDDAALTGGKVTVTLKADQTYEITDLPAGTTYTVTEESLPDGYTEGTHTGDSGTIPTGAAATATMKNTYAGSGTSELEIIKEVSGAAWPEGATATFEVTADDGVPMPEKTSMTLTKAGTAEFGTISYTLADAGQTYIYTIAETGKGFGDGWTVDPETVTATVVVGDDKGDGTLTESIVTYDPENKTITNTRETGGLKVSKSVVSSTASDKTKEFTFTVTLDDTSITGTYGEMTFENGVATFRLKDGETCTAEGLPTTVGYTVAEEDVTAENFVTTATGTTGTIEKDATPEAAFTNTKAEGGLVVTKSVTSVLAADKDQKFHFKVTLDDKTISGTYGQMIFENGVAEFDLKDGESCAAEGLPEGIGYMAAEKVDGRFTTTCTGVNGTIGKEKTVIAAFVNTRNTGDLEVSKTVVSDKAADKDQKFTFTVTLSDKTISGTYGDMTFAEGVATVELKGGESKAATGLPTEIGYTVTETAVSGFITEKTGDTGTISSTTSTAAFTNTRETGGLKVSKSVVSSTASDKTKEFTFTVTLDDTSISGTYGEMIFENGVATFQLKDGETCTAEGLPTTVGYTVAEEDVTAENFVTTATGTTGTIAKDATPEAAFTNTKSEGGLAVTKSVTSVLAADKDQKFHFKVTLDDKTISGTYGQMIFENGVAEFDLKDGESCTAEGLPEGIGYMAAEKVDDRFTTTSTGETGTIEEEKTVTAAFVNTRNTGDLEISKTVVSDKAADKDQKFTFTVTLSDKTISGTYGDMTFAEGVATVELKGGESKAATGLPTEITYTVAETEATGFTADKTEAAGTITTEKSMASFTNTRETGGLKVSKSVVSSTASDKTKEFTFTVTLDDTSITGTYGEMTFENGVATFQLKDGETCTAEGLPTTVGYTVAEEDVTAENFVTTAAGTTGTIEKDTEPEAAFTNTKSEGGLAVTKSVTSVLAADKDQKFHFKVTLEDKTISGTYGQMTFENGVAEFDLKDGESCTAEGLPEGIGYMAAEKVDGRFTTTSTGETGTIEEEKTATAAFVNTSNTGDLEVSKTVVSDKAVDKDRVFIFTVTLSDKTISGTYGDMTFAEGVATVELKGGESKAATGLPTEITYTVAETEATGFTADKTEAAGTITTEKSTVAFTNTRETGGLKVSKSVVSSTASDKTKEFTFTVTLDDTSISGTYGEMTFENGVATFRLKDGETCTAEGLPTTVGYTVAEEDVTAENFEVTSTGTIGTIEKDTVSEAEFTNTRKTGSLKITKNVTVNAAATDGSLADGTYSFDVADAEGTVVTTIELTIVNGVSSTAQIDDLLPGKYVITEKAPDNKTQLAGINGIEVEVEGNNTETIPTAEFTNNLNVISVVKVDSESGEALEGATLQVLDKDGNVVEEWISTKEAHEIAGLKTGETYTLRETVAPEGYVVTTDTTFMIDETGKVTTTGKMKDGILLVENTRQPTPTPTQTVTPTLTQTVTPTPGQTVTPTPTQIVTPGPTITPTPDRTPKTGDDSPISNLVVLLILALAAIGAAGVGIYSRKKRK